ncbi:MAG: hypothetical protein HPY52_08580 [Firmicutes bacterium]|nr:hypothetical protein [Bacillota bacterium]
MIHPMEVIFRTIAAFAGILVATRIIGEVVSPLSHIDLAARITLGSMAADMAYNLRLSALDTMLAIFVFSLLSLLTSWAALFARPLRKLLVGILITLSCRLNMKGFILYWC